MTAHSIPTVHMDGQEWVPRFAYDTVLASLREKQRSQQSHNRYFAAINDLYESLPISHADAPYAKSADAFRKHCLIQAGYCDVDTISFESVDAARKAAPFIANLARKAHGYALTVARGNLVVCSTPHSQSFRAMGRETFHASVAACEDRAKLILGVD